MRIAILLLAFVALSAFAAPDPKHQKDLAECSAAAAKVKVQHPADVKKAQEKSIERCMKKKPGYGQARPASGN